ncbi:MAG TPA: heavy metal translocating P-type ATPase [Rhodocyclaceae bacterium]|nr:heavy metal translocating P-type ATPase [Rhodocyclaceae bacterium]
MSDESLQTLELNLSGMRCASCAARIEKQLNSLAGVEAVVNFAAERAYVRYTAPTVAPERLIEAVSGLGFAASRIDPDDAQAAHAQKARKAEEYRDELRRFLIAAALTLPLMLQMAFMFTANQHEDVLPRLWQLALATPVQFWIGARFYSGAWHAVRSGAGSMDVLVALGTSMAWGYSAVVTLFGWQHQHVYFEASATVITLVLLGKILEARAKAKTSAAIEALIELQPQTAQREHDGQLQTVPVASLIPGDIVVVRSGEAVPVDAEIVEGRSSLNESMLTGESLPVAKQPGDAVYAATINGEGLLRCRATQVGQHTLLAGIVRLVQQAQGSKAPVQRLADRVAMIFVPVVIVIAVLTLIGWLWLGGDFAPAMVNAVAVLVIACPCALGLATPTALMVGTGLGARAGILIRNAVALEQAEKLRYLAVDKTGTLTEGKPQVAALTLTTKVGAGKTDEDAAGTLTIERILQLAASLEQGATHPLAAAIVAHARAQGLDLLPPKNVVTAPGQGLSGEIDGLSDGLSVHVGSPAWLRDEVGDSTPPPCETNDTQVGVAVDRRIVAWLALRDPLRASSRAAIARLQGLGVEVVMLTGDNAATAANIAQAVGIRRYSANILPAAKADAVRALQAGGHCVGMVGDGINDAPALAAADVGFAMGAGADVAMHTADITLMHNDLNAVADAIALSRATLAKIRQNLFFAFIYNLLGIPLAAFGLLNPVVAGAAMALSSVSVVSNSLLLRRVKLR